MIATSNKYKTELYNATDCYIYGSLTLGDDETIELTSDDILQNSFKFQESCVASAAFGVGGMIANQIDIGLFLDINNPFLLTAASITLNCKYIFDDGSEQDLPIGTFYVDSGSVQRTNHTVSFTAYDGMILFDKPIPKDTAILHKETYKFIQAACEACGVDLATNIATLMRMPNGKASCSLKSRDENATEYNWRDLLTYAAQLLGAFGRINRSSGKLEIVPFSQTVDFTINEDNAINRSVSDTSVKVTGAKFGDQLSGGEGFVLDLSNNPLMESLSESARKEKLDALVEGMQGVEFYQAQITWFGDLSIQAGDCFNYEQEGLFGGTRKVIVMESVWKLGESCSIMSYGDTTANQYSPISKIALAQAETLEYVKANYLLAQTAEIAYAKITELQAANAEITRLEAEYLAANQAIIDDLTANTGRIADLEVNALTADSAVIKKLQTEMLTAESAEIGDLKAAAALFNTFSSVFGFTKNAQFINLTAANVTIDEAVIKDIIAKKITVADLITASAQAERIDIIKDGSASISFLGATQQFYDSDGNVRVQIGQAADGNFSFVVRGVDGKTALFDENGITENAVADGLIVDNMVSDNAHISGGKIDMHSLIEEINGSNYKLKTSTIAYDEDGQSLDLKFTELSESVTEIGTLTTEQGTKLDAIVETVTDHGTNLEVINGQINSKIWQNDITTATAGLVSETQLTSRLSEVNQTIDSITSTVSSMQTTIDEKADGTAVTQISTQMAEMQQDLSGFKTTVSNTYATQDGLNSAMDFAMSSISQQADQIALKVNKDGVISAINQSAEEITIDASKIDLSGYVTFTAHQGAISGLSNAISSVSSTANSAKAWTDENGTNMTALRDMVMKWTNNAVSTSTYIRGGWIATNTITAEKLAIGLNGNIITYGIDTFEGDLVDVSGCAKNNLTNAEITDEYSRYGENSLKVITNGASWCYIKLEGDDFGKKGNIPVTNGDYYVFSFYVRSTSHDSISFSPLLYKHSISSETSGTSYVQLTKRTLTGLKSGWVRYISAQFKLDCNFVTIRLDINDQSSPVTAYFDCLQLERVENTLQTASPWKPNGATVIDGATIATGTVYATSIHANAITADKIAAVTASKINVSSLQAVSANIGGFKISSNNLISANSSSFKYNNSTIYYLRTMLSPTGFGIMFDGQYSTTAGAHGYDGYRLKIEGLTQGATPYESAISVTGPGLCYVRSISTNGTVTNLMRFAGSDAYNASNSLQHIYVFQSAYFASTISCTSLTERSDERFKTDINDMSDKYIDLFDHLAPKTFRFKDDPEKLHTGFIAQELLSAIDKSGLMADEVGAFVDVNKDGSEYHIAYTELTAILTAKIKQLENKISKLEVKINENNSN